mmetsp:Transcript_17651/g.57706  ORF Transcript_17651/g.57706 Transcript_17651/m.57706 type:complete len:219 (+) Transcript_17651:1636-2292(+)
MRESREHDGDVERNPNRLHVQQRIHCGRQALLDHTVTPNLLADERASDERKGVHLFQRSEHVVPHLPRFHVIPERLDATFRVVSLVRKVLLRAQDYPHVWDPRWRNPLPNILPSLVPLGLPEPVPNLVSAIDDNHERFLLTLLPRLGCQLNPRFLKNRRFRFVRRWVHRRAHERRECAAEPILEMEERLWEGRALSDVYQRQLWTERFRNLSNHRRLA